MDRDEAGRDTYPGSELAAPATPPLLVVSRQHDRFPSLLASLRQEQGRIGENSRGRRGRREAEGKQASKRARGKRTGRGQLDRSLIPHHIIYATDPRPPRGVLAPDNKFHRQVGHHFSDPLWRDWTGRVSCRLCIFRVGCDSCLSAIISPPPLHRSNLTAH